MENQDLVYAKEQITLIGKLGSNLGLFTACNGNISLKLAKDRFLITASGSSKARLKSSDFSLMDHQGNLLAGPKISTESPVHLAIYAKTNASAILHCHPPKLLALDLKAKIDLILQLPLFESQRWSQILIQVSSLPPGSKELALAVEKEIQDKIKLNLEYSNLGAIWLKNHGLFTFGSSLEDSLNLAEELEHLAEITLLANLV
ncbi:MAG: class II aldolase/adducin family protein [Desulfovibrionaceae bacterium]|nr:class II aldolase/adducin family protein [Desulfovibrionaceae bacterium]